MNPFLLSIQDKVWNEFGNPYLANLNRINISLISKGDGWNDCDSDTYICDDGVTDLYMDVEINFVPPSWIEDDVDIDYEIEWNPNQNVIQIISLIIIHKILLNQLEVPCDLHLLDK